LDKFTNYGPENGMHWRDLAEQSSGIHLRASIYNYQPLNDFVSAKKSKADYETGVRNLYRGYPPFCDLISFHHFL